MYQFTLLGTTLNLTGFKIALVIIIKCCGYTSNLSSLCQLMHSIFLCLGTPHDRTTMLAKKDVTKTPPEYWKRPPGCPQSTRMMTVPDDLKCHNLTLTEQSIWLRISHSEGCWVQPVLCSPTGANHGDDIE